MLRPSPNHGTQRLPNDDDDDDVDISRCHWKAVERSITLHTTTKDAGEHISSTREEDKANNNN